jgi:hypothetical protein
MNAKTKRGKIPSIKIDKEFLEKFGSVLESEVKERNILADRKNEAEILVRQKEIYSRAYYKTDEDKLAAIQEMKDSVLRYGSPHVSVQYSIDAKDEDLTFPSIQDLIDTKFFPEKINSFSARVSHYGNTEYVDISVRMSQQWYGITAEYNLSSVDSGRLLKIEDELKKTFRDSTTEYKSVLYPVINQQFLIIRLVSFLFSLAVAYSIYHFSSKELKTNIGIFSLVWIIFIAAYHFCARSIKSLYPYFNYSITPDKSFKKYIGIAIVALISSISFAAIYDLIKTLIR